VVRFQPRFPAFAREYSFCPRACNPAAPWEKGKTERALGYIRSNFRIHFDANRYCVPPRLVGWHLTVKAHSQSVTI
jgi:transposase